jgi:hypothetical protein
MRSGKLTVILVAGTICLASGCRKNQVDTGAFKSALNNYLSSQQQCLFGTPIKFPQQADTSNDEQTKQFDALTDQGMLTRKPEEKKRFLIGSKQVNDYDLSDKGRSSWTVDASQPGYGNFCYGHPEVTAIDGYTPAAPDAAQYTVSYHYKIASLPDWTNNAEMKTAFPRLNAQSAAPQAGTATLMKSSNGWVVQNAQPAANEPSSPAQ